MKGTFLLTASLNALAGLLLSDYIRQYGGTHLRFAVIIVLLGVAAIGVTRVVRALDKRSNP